MIQFEQWREAETRMTGEPAVKPGHRETWFHPGQTADFAYRCQGHSMVPTFYPGELVFIHQQNTFTDGQIVAVQIGDGRTLKRLYRLSDGFKLVPDNEAFQPVTITGKDADQVKVIGVAVARR
jgi:SOS-response transcriptional repressor LexA